MRARRREVRAWRAALLLTAGLTGAGGLVAADDRQELVGEDLSAWRGNTGSWLVAGAATLDPANPSLLATSDGGGVLVNGPDGKTVDLLSVLEHGDVEVTGPTRAATWGDEKPLGPLMLQGDHGPVAFRKVVVRALPAP